MAINRPDRPIPRDEVGPTSHQIDEQEERENANDEAEATGDGPHPEHPDREALLRERSEGAHSEQIGDDANFRADESPPGS